MTHGLVAGASVNTYPIKQGPATLLGNVPDGSLITNTSDTYPVFVGPGTGVSSTNGIRIGPLGSVTWQNKQTSCYAILGTKDDVTVDITVSDMVVNPQSPLDVANALIDQGIPSKLLVDHIGDYTGNTNIDVSDYSTILIYTKSVNNLSNIQVKWLLNPTTVAFESDHFFVTVGDTLTYLTSVYSGLLRIENQYAETYSLYGYNRKLTEYPVTTILATNNTNIYATVPANNSSYSLSVDKVPEGLCTIYTNITVKGNTFPENLKITIGNNTIVTVDQIRFVRSYQNQTYYTCTNTVALGLYSKSFSIQTYPIPYDIDVSTIIMKA